ncbi:COS111 [Candida margitis]|uniref:COS111 n=1 Tax=Candida margitis TaxID=1775924 RepID=UPI002227C210|nr:COS111 [Candida margitis]KAI5969285.1 COS111 [Candida margitis]
MLETEAIDFHNHLPPYRSLLNPNARYDYRTHTLIPLSQNDLNFLQSFFRSGGRSTPIFSYSQKWSSRSNNGSSRGNSSNNSTRSGNRNRNVNISTNTNGSTRPSSVNSATSTTTKTTTPFISPSNANAVDPNLLSSDITGRNTDQLSDSYIENAIALTPDLGNQYFPPPSASSSSSTTSATSNQLSRGIYRSSQDASTSTTFKMKYKSLLNDVGRSISMRLSNNNLLAGSTHSSSNNNSNNNSNGIVNISRSSTILSSAVKRKSSPSITNIRQMPEEILDYIFFLVDCKSDYANCLLTCKLFYHTAKPYFYENLSFTSTYRFAQFVSYLRLNSNVGQYVKTIDLSGVKPGYDEDAEEDDDQVEEEPEHINEEGENVRVNNRDMYQLSKKKILAGWRDWKFKNNPLYTVHPYPAGHLTKISSNSQFSISSNRSNSSQKSSSSKRFTKPFKYFKTRKRSRSFSGNLNSRKAPKLETLNLNNRPNGYPSTMSNPHPLINKFLLNYSTSKDVPIGYVLHLVNLCPNVCSLNFGGLSLSTDYEISRSSMCKYQTFDLMNNYPKDLLHRIDNSMKKDDSEELASSIEASLLYNRHQENRFSRNLVKSNQSNASTASSIYSVTTFSKPIRKYNSLLPPLPPTLADISYVKKGDRRVYLSDLNLKSINNAYLRKIDEREVLLAITKIHGKQVHSYKMQQLFGSIEEDVAGNLRYINLSSMIWLNRDLIEKFLKKLLVKRSDELVPYGYYAGAGADTFANESDSELDSELDLIDYEHNPVAYKQDLVVDLSNSGMYKNLLWAKRIDLNTVDGCKLVDKIIRNELLPPHEEFLRRERLRRGRIGENYLA